MTKKQDDDDNLSRFLKRNKPQPKAAGRDLEERILMATALKPTPLQAMANFFRMRLAVFAIPPMIGVAAVLLFSFYSQSGVEKAAQQSSLVALSDQEQGEIADFMEGTWQQSLGDSAFEDLMEETSL